MQNNRIIWKSADQTGYIADQTNGKFTATEKAPTYGLLAKVATDITGETKIDNIYDWSGAKSAYWGKQVTLQTTKYETGIEDAPKTSGSAETAPTELPVPVIKQNAYPYNFVTCKQAQSLASSMESGEYTSSLMFGVQWDLVLKYLETKVAATQSELKSDSTYWGNYKNNTWTISNAKSKYNINGKDWTNGAYGEKTSTSSILLSTGASDTFSKTGARKPCYFYYFRVKYK